MNFNININIIKMEKELEEKNAYDKLAGAIGGFVGRTIGNFFLSVLSALINALVFAFALMWIWNDFIEKGVFIEGAIFITYWQALKIVFLVRFLLKGKVVAKKSFYEEGE